MHTLKDSVEGWGRTSSCSARLAQVATLEQLRHLVDSSRRTRTPISIRASGLSYGDGALLLNGLVAVVTGMNRIIHFDPTEGTLEAEAGLTIVQALKVVVSHGWILPVIPGTRRVTLGGAVSNNIHGKNCVKVGNFGECVESFRILLSSGDILLCSRQENADLFYGAIGGLGLLGAILQVKIRLIRAPSQILSVRYQTAASLAELIDLMEASIPTSDYLISQIDGFGWGGSFGRGTLSSSRFVSHEKDARHIYHEIPERGPGVFPLSWRIALARSMLAHGPAIAAAATFRYGIDRALRSHRDFKQSLSRAMFLMDDNVPDYNMYFRHGHYQYQPIFPRRAAKGGLQETLRILRELKTPTVLVSLKAHRAPRDEGYMMPFALDGYSLAVDIPKRTGQPAHYTRLFARLNELVIAQGGRLYLAKTVPLDREGLRAMYPDCEKLVTLKRQYDPTETIQTNLYRRIFLDERSCDSPDLPY